VDQARDIAPVVPQRLPVGVPCDLEVLAGAPAQVYERVVEAAELEERLQPRLLDPGEVDELAAARGDLLGRRLDRCVGRELTAVDRRLALERDGIGHAAIGIVGFEVDRRLQPVAEAVDVRGVGINVLAQRVRVLEHQAERVRVVGRRERARRQKRRAEVLACGEAGRVLNARVRAHDHGLQDRLQPFFDHARGQLRDHPRCST
jgi:hypothetical protein